MSGFVLRLPAPLRTAPIVRARPVVVHANPLVQSFYDLSEEEILEQVGELKKELFSMRAARAVGNPVKTHLFKQYRKRIAQLLTVKRKKEIEQGISKRESRKREKNALLEAGLWVR